MFAYDKLGPILNLLGPDPRLHVPAVYGYVICCVSIQFLPQPEVLPDRHFVHELTKLKILLDFSCFLQLRIGIILRSSHRCSVTNIIFRKALLYIHTSEHPVQEYISSVAVTMTFSQWIGDRVPTLIRPTILLLTSAYRKDP